MAVDPELKHPLGKCEVDPWFRQQGRPPVDEIQRFEDDMGRAIAVRALTLVVLEESTRSPILGTRRASPPPSTDG
jgi:hypothetical protein